MSLEFETVDVRFTEGQDTRTQRKLVVAGKWDTLLNYSLSEDNTPKIRDGAAALLLGQNANGVALHNDELVLTNLGTVSTVGATAAVAKAVTGELPYVDMARSEVDFTQGNHDMLDVAYGNGLACYVWRDYANLNSGSINGIRCTVVDLASGTKLVNAASVSGADSAATSPRVVFTDNAFFIVWVSALTVFAAVIATSTPTAVGAFVALVVSGNVSTKNIDACPSGTSNVLVSFVFTDGVSSVKSMTIKRTGTVPSIVSGPTQTITEVFLSNATLAGLCNCTFSSSLNGVFATQITGGNILLVGATVNASAAVVTSASTMDFQADATAISACHVGACVSNSKFIVFYDQANVYNAVGFSPLRAVTCTSVLGGVFTVTVASSSTFRINATEAAGPQGPFIAGKPFVSTFGGVSSVFLPVCMLENYFRPSAPLGVNVDSASAQCAFYLLDVSNAIAGSTPLFVTVAGALYGSYGLVDSTLGGGPPTVQTPCSVAGPTASGGYIIATQERGKLNLLAGINATPVGISAHTMTPRIATGEIAAQLGKVTYFTGGLLGAYDGRQVLEAGSLVFPEGSSFVVSAPGTGVGLTVGVHQLVAVYEWTDGAGNRTQSAPCFPVSVTVVNANDVITCKIPTTQLAAASGSSVITNISTLSIVIYMTAAGGTDFFRLPPPSFTSPITNTTSAAFVTVVLAAAGTQIMTDARITQNELLSTQPGQPGTPLANVAPGPANALCVSQNRLWYIGADPFSYFFSQEPQANTGLQFNPALGGRLPGDSGGGIALSPLDEKTIVFTSRKPYVIYGTGPTTSGSFNNFSEPQELPSDVGCSDARSVLRIPDGIIFKSTMGWHLLGRDLAVRYIGEGVSRFDSQTVTSAVLMQDRKEARFTMSGGVTLVFSTLLGAWSYFIYGTGTGTGTAVADAKWWPALGKYVWTSQGNGTNSDTPGQTLDTFTGSPIVFSTLARTAFLKTGAMEGFQRARRLYLTGTTSDALSLDSVLALTVYFNDSYSGPHSYTTNIQTSSFLTSELSAEAVDFRHVIEVLQKCKSIAFQFLDTPNGPGAVGLSGVQALALEIGRKKGVRRLPASQST